MSRGFGPNFGVAGTDAVFSRFSGLSTKHSFSVWAYINTYSPVVTSSLFANGATGTTRNLWAISTAQPNQIQYSETWTGANAGQYKFPGPAIGGWHHLLTVNDTSSTSNTPSSWIDALLTTMTIINNPPSGTWSGLPGQKIAVGNNSEATPTRPFDGMLAHFACWNGVLLGQAEASALANGVNPMLIMPEFLSTYLPLDGINNPEYDLILGNSSSITGTLLGRSDPPARSIYQVPLIDSIFTPLISTSVAAAQLPDAGSISAKEAIASSIAGAQQSDSSALSAAELIAASLASAQAGDYAQINAAEVLTASLVAYQRGDFGAVSAGQLVAAAIVAVQQADFGALSLDEIVGAALTAWQGPDAALISASKIISATLVALQDVGYARITEAEIIQAIISARQQMNYTSFSQLSGIGFARLRDRILNSVVDRDVSLYTVALTDRALGSVVLTDRQP